MTVGDVPSGGSWQTAIRSDPVVGPLYAAGVPVVAAEGEPPRAVFASASAAALFEAADLDAVDACVFSSAGARTRPKGSLGPAAPPRLERARLTVGGRAQIVTLLRRALALPEGGPLLVVAMPEVRRSRLKLSAGARDLVAHVPGSPSRTIPPPQPADTGRATNTAPASAGGRRQVEADAGPTGAPACGRTLRILWQSDRTDSILPVSEEWEDALGGGVVDLAGAALPDLVAQSGNDPEGLVAARLARRETFGPIEVAWPISDNGPKLPVRISGFPVFKDDKEFSGYRGFGLLDRDRLAALGRVEAGAPSPPPPRQAPAEPAAAAAALPARSNEIAGAVFGETGELLKKVVQLRPSDGPPRYMLGKPAPARGAVAAESPASTLRGETAGARLVELRSTRAEAPEGASRFRISASEGTASAGRPAEVALSPGERHAFHEIARALGVRLQDHDPVERSTETPAGTAPAGESADPPDPIPPEESSGTAGAPSSSSAESRGSAAEIGRHAFAVLERVPIGILVAHNGAAVYLNRTLLELLGYQSIAAFQAAGGFERMFRGRSPEALAAQPSSIALVTREGDAVTVEGRLHAIDWDGAQATLMSFRRSIEEEVARRLQALELALRAREVEVQELRAILDTATDGIVGLDAEGTVVSINRPAEALFGYDPDEIAGQAFTRLLAQESQDSAREYFTRLKSGWVEGVLNHGREVLGRARQGSILPLFLTIGRLPVGERQKFCAVLHDLTPWKKVERDLDEARRQAERASQLKSDFLARVSHEVRTPLNAILGFAEVIMEERFGPIGNERYKDYIRDIHTSGSHVMSLVNDLLDLSKIEAGKMELSFAPVDANKVVRDCVALMQPEAARERVIIRTALAQRLPQVIADERSLRQIVLNLLSNAVKFNEPGGQVIVSSALTDSGRAVVRIRDTGIGMSETDLATALEPFRQLPVSHRKTGTGLGLPLTKALVEANHASFTIKSKKNEGTLVEVAFPLATAPAGQAAT